MRNPGWERDRQSEGLKASFNMKTKSQVKLNLPSRVAQKVDQGAKVVTMSKAAMPGPQPLIDTLDTANNDLAEKQAAAIQARQIAKQATAAAKASAKAQALAYGNLANHVETLSDGSTSFILSTGYGVRATPAPVPTPGAPLDLRAKMGADTGTILTQWTTVLGAKAYEVDYTTDLSGATGWVSADETPSKGRLLLKGLDSGTVYLIRVCALGNGASGPYANPVQQMAP